MGLVAKGTTFAWNSQTVAKLRSIGSPELSIDIIDVSNHQSANGKREKLASFGDWGEFPIEGSIDHTDTNGQVAMVTDAKAGTARTFVITPPSSPFTLTGTGIISKIKFGDFPHDGEIPFTATITVSGDVTLAVTTVTGMSAIGFSNDVLMMPAFAIGRYGADNPYVVTITNGETSTVITPVDATSGEVITIVTDGAGSQVVATGEASSACTLDTDDVTQIVVTISKTGYASKSYYFNCVVLAA